jgi:hypothetical protein
MTGPTGQLLSRLAGAWRQVATAREREGRVTAATAASAAAHTTHRATSSEATFAVGSNNLLGALAISATVSQVCLD